MAQLPKPPDQRRRRNKDQANWTTLGYETVVPEAERPKFPGRKPPAAALRYWDAIWASPLGVMYLEVDHEPLSRMCRIHAADIAGKASAADRSELRQLEQLFGISPRARRQLQWEIDRAAGAGTAHMEQPVDRERVTRDRRARLGGNLAVVQADT